MALNDINYHCRVNTKKIPRELLLSCVNPTRSLLQDLKIECLAPDIYCDNQSTVYLSQKPMLDSHTKHLELNIFSV